MIRLINSLPKAVHLLKNPKFCYSTASSSIAQETLKSFDEIPSLPKDNQNSSTQYFIESGGFDKYPQTMLKLHEKHGPIFRFNFAPGGSTAAPDQISITDTNVTAEIYRNEVEGQVPHRPLLQAFKRYREYKGLPQSLVNTNDDKEWRTQRQVINERLFSPAIAKTYIPRLDFIAKDFVSRISLRNPKDENYAKDINNDIFGFSLEAISSIVFGKRLGTLSADPNEVRDPKIQKFITSVNGLFTTSVPLLFYPPSFPDEQFYKLPEFQEHVKHTDYILELTEDLLKSNNGRESLFEFYLSKEEINPLLARLMATDIFAAGVDTTSRLIQWLFHNLADNPLEIQLRLREEIIKYSGKEGKIDEKMLNKMSYLKDCLKESLRLYPIAASNARILTADQVLLGYKIPAGTQVAMETYSMSRDPKTFTDPELFNPSRWKEEFKQNKSKNKSFSVLPFGFGQRMCPGRRVAENEVQLLIANLIRDFNISYSEGSRKPEPVFNLLMLKKDLQLTEHEEVIATEVIHPDDINVSFKDIGGLEDVIESLQENVIYPLKFPDLYSSVSVLLGAPKGVLLYGPPGCGKTMLAKALAKESGATFINLHVSTLTDKWFGESQKLVHALFTLALKLQPSIIFIDEIDSFLRERNSSDHEASSMMKAEFMSLWDGLSGGDQTKVLVLGATNRPNDIDKAILRRMPRRFPIALPNAVQRKNIFNLLLSTMKLHPSFDMEELVERTKGFSGSDIKEMCRNAVMVPVRESIRKLVDIQNKLDNNNKKDKFNNSSLSEVNIKDVKVRLIVLEDFFAHGDGGVTLGKDKTLTGYVDLD
ncbi:hypothetical protein HK099_008250 [Clydaea vesicula]|uniref:AAA+ ATPase domain-containing protein n=1 Tax=Clydaea vesicula TaxID=447962 RepID=A0AAD5Y0C4_9FUNG|nr:hypothetical protein HK099_008250 [Clydaea vesicula]KAJ3392564.1 hypothetical protein HDU92_008323 [Lobulomyces angularis]